MSSPKSNTTKLFKLERTSSGVFRIPRRFSSTSSVTEDTTSEISSDMDGETIKSESSTTSSYNNELSKHISATVKLKTRSNSNKANYHNQQPQYTGYSPLNDAVKSRPNLAYNNIFTGKSLSPVLQRSFLKQMDDPLKINEEDDYETDNDFDDQESDDEKLDHDDNDHYQFLRLISNFDFLEIIFLICNFLSTVGARSIVFLKSSRYVTTERDGKVHLHSFVYGFACGILLISMKPWLYTGLSYLASVTFNLCMCIIVVVSISVSLTQRKKPITQKEHQQQQQQQQGKREIHYNTRSFPLDLRKSSQLPLLNPINTSNKKSGASILPYSAREESFRVPLRPIYKSVNHSADALLFTDHNNNKSKNEFEDLEDDEDLEDETKSLFSVLTNGGNNLFNSKKNYKSFIEQTKKVKMVS